MGPVVADGDTVVADRMWGGKPGRVGASCWLLQGECRGREGELAWSGEDSQTCWRELRAVDPVTKVSIFQK